MIGGNESLILIIWTQDEAFLHASVATQVLVNVALHDKDPDKRSENEIPMTAVLIQLSVAVANPVLEGLTPELQGKIRSFGQVIIGLTWS